MNNWTVDQVGEWLAANGLEMYVRNFVDEDIDGTALMGLREEDVRKLLSDGTGKPPRLRIQRKFRTVLEKYRSSVTIQSTNELETYSKIYPIEPTSDSLKFFRSELICSNLSKYLLRKYNVQCQIPMLNQYETKNPLNIKLSGGRENVKNVQKDLQVFFATIKTKIFNDENADKRVIKWSKHIYSDSALSILQKIFSDKKKFTIWEKTSVLSGYYIVHYLAGQHRFSTTEESISEILNNEISYAKDLMVPDGKKFEEFVREKKEQQQRHQIMAIIVSQYPSQREMKISFFGLKTQVHLAKKQLKMLIDQQRMRTIRLELDSTQREYLLDNCVHQLRSIELDHQDDKVKIQIRENLIHAPQYLVNKIKQSIQSMIYQRKTLVFQYIENALALPESWESLTRSYHFEIEEIKTETRKELIALPKGKNTSASKYILQESKQFHASLSISTILPLSKHTIELHKSYDLPVSLLDITVISTIADAHREKLDPDYGNGYFESDDGRKILFIKWPLLRSQENPNQMNILIKKFLSTAFQQIDALGIDAIKTIAFSTTDWEKYDPRKQLVEGILQEMKSQLESEQFSRQSWRILFLFPEEQNDLGKEFSQVMSTGNDICEQFFYPVTTTSIVLRTSGNTNISKCEHAIHTHLRKYLATIRLNHPFSSERWNQCMINAFYKYCLDILVLPKIDRMNNGLIQSLDLIGSITAINEAKEKYELMSEIERNRPSDCSNIILSCSSDDQIFSRQLAQRLMDEGYLVSTNSSSDAQQSSTIKSKLHQTDLVIICFSSNYSKDFHCMNTMQSIKQSSKKFIPILFTKTSLNQDDDWLQRMATEEWFYESFEQEIRFRLKENLNLDYDRLIIELFQYTKLGAVGRTCPIVNLEGEEEQREDVLEVRDTPPRFTSEQIQEEERVYQQQIENILQRKKIPDKELEELIQSLKTVLEESDQSEEEEIVVPSSYVIEFLFSIQRWLGKATKGPMIKGNLPPFTLTGDYNDAIFPVLSTDKAPWWMATANLAELDHSTPVYPRLTVGSWCNYDDTHDYYQNLLDRDIRFRKFKQKERAESEKGDDAGQKPNNTGIYPHFKTTLPTFFWAWHLRDTMPNGKKSQKKEQEIRELKKQTLSWDITENSEVLEEYERRQSKKITGGYDRWMDRAVKLISDLKEGKLVMESDEVQGKIGNELKIREEIRKREQLDDPANNTWKSKRLFRWRRKFIEIQTKNTFEWKEFCAKQ